MYAKLTICCFALLLMSGIARALECRPAFAAHNVVEKEFLSEINRFRVRYGLNTLTLNAQLTEASQDYACKMADTGHFDHTGPDGSTPAERARRAGYNYCQLGENLAMGYDGVVSVTKGWILSPGHRKNMLLDGVTEIGIATALRNRGAKRTPGLAEALGGRVVGATEGTAMAAPVGAGSVYWVLMLGRSGC